MAKLHLKRVQCVLPIHREFSLEIQGNEFTNSL